MPWRRCTTLWPKGNPTPIEATALLTAAAPHLERHYRALFKAELAKRQEKR